MSVHTEYFYDVEEFHRGDWEPLMRKLENGEKTQKAVKITEEQAEVMNGQSKYHKLRYVKSKEQDAKKRHNALKELEAKKPGDDSDDSEDVFDYKKAKKDDLIAYCVENGINLDGDEGVKELRALIEESLK